MTSEPPPAPRPAPSLGRSLTCLLQADALVQIRNLRALFLSLVLPVILLLAVNGGKRGSKLGAPQLRVALAITLGMVSIGVIGYAAAVARDRDQGVFQRLRVTPAPTWMIMGSRLAVQTGAVIVMTVTVLIAASLFEGVTLSAEGYLLSLVVVVVGAAVFLSIGQAVVGLIPSADTLNAVGRLLYIPLLGLTVFGHSDVLGTTIEYISRWSPGGAFDSLLSGAMSPSTWTSETWIALPVCCGYALLFTGVGVRWFRWTSR